MKIYLAGGMKNLSYEQQNRWRDDVKYAIYKQLTLQSRRINVEIINPIEFYNYVHPSHTTEKEVFNYDTRHVTSSDLIIVNANDPNSVGTSIEIGMAYKCNIPILIYNSNHSVLHEWWIHCSDRIFDSMDELIHYIMKYHLKWRTV